MIAVSEALKRALDTNKIPHTCVVHNGIDIESWEASNSEIATFRDTHSLQGKKVILFGGRLSRDKGSTPLLHALSIVIRTVPDVLLLVVGDAKRWAGLLQEAHVQEDISAHILNIEWLAKDDMRAMT
ncbi:MAG: hypothetical protein O2904_01435 [bacterium]|nr:hypothetical protein [bacterium]